METYATLHTVLVKLFNDILDIEGRAIARGEFSDLTCNEIHVIEAIGLEGGLNMSSIAKKLDVTMGTLTTAMNALVRKGYVDRKRGQEDRRIVRISLLDKGKRVFERHRQFHENMIDAVIKNLNSQETEVLEGALNRLNRFFLETEF